MIKSNFQFANKKVIILLKTFALGGAEKQALYLAHHLESKCNCKVYIYSYIESDKRELFDSFCESLGINNLYVENNPLSASGSFKFLKRMFKIVSFGLKLKKHNPDIIIPYLNPSSIIASLSYKVSGAKTTFWHHRGPDYYRGDLLEKLAAKRVPLFVANSIDGKKELDVKLRVKSNSYFIPNFSTINKINFKKDIPELNEVKNKVIIGMIAHFRIQKKQDILVEVYNELLKKNNNIHLVLVGDIHDDRKEKSNFKKVVNFVSEHGLEKNVTILHGKKAEDVLPYLDIGVLISDKEGMPNTVMEFMGYSLPVITTKHEGCISLLGENYPYFINNLDKNDQYIKFEQLINSEQKRKEIGLKNNKRLIEKFNIGGYINKLTSIINK